MKPERVATPELYQDMRSIKTYDALEWRKVYLRGGYFENTLLTTSLNCFSRLSGVAFSL